MTSWEALFYVCFTNIAPNEEQGLFFQQLCLSSPESFVSQIILSLPITDGIIKYWYSVFWVSFWISLLSLFLKWQSREELKGLMHRKLQNCYCPFVFILGSSIQKGILIERTSTNKSIMKKHQTHKLKRGREQTSLKIILCVSTQKQFERIQANLNAACTVGMIYIIANFAILFNCRIFGNLAHLFICWFTYMFL